MPVGEPNEAKPTLAMTSPTGQPIFAIEFSAASTQVLGGGDGDGGGCGGGCGCGCGGGGGGEAPQMWIFGVKAAGGDGAPTASDDGVGRGDDKAAAAAADAAAVAAGMCAAAAHSSTPPTIGSSAVIIAAVPAAEPAQVRHSYDRLARGDDASS
eukprot:COSAG01_NODE_15891_length_1287_cov_11.744108_1_plen_154_part_00